MNADLAERSYLVGHVLSKHDADMFARIRVCLSAGDDMVHVHRWYNHISSFSSQERSKFSVSSVAIKIRGGDHVPSISSSIVNAEEVYVPSFASSSVQFASWLCTFFLCCSNHTTYTWYSSSGYLMRIAVTQNLDVFSHLTRLIYRSRMLPLQIDVMAACIDFSNLKKKFLCSICALQLQKKETEGKKKACELNPPPDYIAERIAMWDRLKRERDAWIAEAAQKREPIKITLPDGKVVDGTKWQTAPLDIATGISKGVLRSYYFQSEY